MQPIEKLYYLCAKEVGTTLNVSTRTAQRLMRTNEVRSFRAGGKLLRTNDQEIRLYVRRQFDTYRLEYRPQSGCPCASCRLHAAAECQPVAEEETGVE